MTDSGRSLPNEVGIQELENKRLEHAITECDRASSDFVWAVRALMEHGATAADLHQQLDEVIERGW